MYRRIGAPVDKVLGFLSDLRSRVESRKDGDNLDWMMEVIASDELYNVAEFDEETLRAHTGGGDGKNDMSRFLSAETGLARRREH